jgi:hypothetical protein
MSTLLSRYTFLLLLTKKRTWMAASGHDFQALNERSPIVVVVVV